MCALSVYLYIKAPRLYANKVWCTLWKVRILLFVLHILTLKMFLTAIFYQKWCLIYFVRINSIKMSNNLLFTSAILVWFTRRLTYFQFAVISYCCNIYNCTNKKKSFKNYILYRSQQRSQNNVIFNVYKDCKLLY